MIGGCFLSCFYKGVLFVSVRVRFGRRFGYLGMLRVEWIFDVFFRRSSFSSMEFLLDVDLREYLFWGFRFG